MIRFSSATTVRALDELDLLGGGRTDLVRRPSGPDSSIFGGWGVKI